MHAYVRAQWMRSCGTLCDPTDCSLPGFFVHGILQARILEWVAMPCSSVFSPPSSPASSGLFCWTVFPSIPFGGPCTTLGLQRTRLPGGANGGDPSRVQGLPFRRAARRWGSGRDPQGGSCLVTGSLSRPQCPRLPAAHPLPGDWPGRIPTSRLLRPGDSRRRQPGNARPRPGAPQPLGFLFGNRLAASALAPAGSPPRAPAEGARRAGKLGDKSILCAATHRSTVERTDPRSLIPNSRPKLLSFSVGSQCPPFMSSC